MLKPPKVSLLELVGMKIRVGIRSSLPKLFRTPESEFDGEVWPYRATWILRMNAWTKVEDRVKWGKLVDSKSVIKPMAEKAIFKFENDVKLSAPSPTSWAHSVANINRVEHEKKGVHLPFRHLCKQSVGLLLKA